MCGGLALINLGYVLSCRTKFLAHPQVPQFVRVWCWLLPLSLIILSFSPFFEENISCWVGVLSSSSPTCVRASFLWSCKEVIFVSQLEHLNIIGRNPVRYNFLALYNFVICGVFSNVCCENPWVSWRVLLCSYCSMLSILNEAMFFPFQYLLYMLCCSIIKRRWLAVYESGFHVIATFFMGFWTVLCYSYFTF